MLPDMPILVARAQSFGGAEDDAEETHAVAQEWGPVSLKERAIEVEDVARVNEEGIVSSHFFAREFVAQATRAVHDGAHTLSRDKGAKAGGEAVPTAYVVGHGAT